MTGNWWDAVGKADFTPDGVNQTLQALLGGVRHYQRKVIALLNTTPDIDKPLLLACLKMTFETVMANDRETAKAAEAILDLPFSTVMTIKDRRKGGDGDGV